MMRNVIIAFVVATGLLAIVPTQASAWVCQAHGSTGASGWGSHGYSLAYARRRALLECARRTPRYARCYITSCY
jgi:hypothetical protein